jgi:adenylyltransferase/sulfurtransferase
MAEPIRLADASRDRYRALGLHGSVWQLGHVRRASALVVGAGALGNEVAKNLAMMGVRLLVVVDKDDVEVANLTRSVFYRESDHGRPKADVLAGRLRELNPDVAVLPLCGDLESVVGLGLLRRVDLIFSCLDNRLARYNLNRMCHTVARPWVDGAMENLFGEVAVYRPDHGPCYACTLSKDEMVRIAEAKSCQRVVRSNVAVGKVPTTPTMGSIVAALQVQEALKVLHGDWKRSLAGRKLVINCLTNDFYPTQSDRKPDCLGHRRFGEVTEVPGWRADRTTPRDVLSKLKAETGEDGWLKLERDVVGSVRCPGCLWEERFDPVLPRITEAQARCPRCAEEREPVLLNRIDAGSPLADRPLARLGVAPLDVLQASWSDEGARWYELTGDAALLNPALAGRGRHRP